MATSRRAARRAPPPPPPPPPPPWWKRRRTWRTLFLLGVLGALFIGWVLFLRPRTAIPARADAIVVLAGHPARSQRAVSLAHRGIAPVLVVSDDNAGDSLEGSVDGTVVRAECGQTGEIEVICVEPVPPTTRGEAATIGALIEARGWKRIVLVTSRYHLTRAKLLFKRCTDAEIISVEGTEDLAVYDWVDAGIHEVGGLVNALFVNTGCAD